MQEIKVLIEEKKIKNRIEELAMEIDKEYKGKELIVISVLKGAIFFTVDLVKNINIF